METLDGSSSVVTRRVPYCTAVHLKGIWKELVSRTPQPSTHTATQRSG
jgi:hypothetical protein